MLAGLSKLGIQTPQSKLSGGAAETKQGPSGGPVHSVRGGGIDGAGGTELLTDSMRMMVDTAVAEETEEEDVASPAVESSEQLSAEAAPEGKDGDLMDSKTAMELDRSAVGATEFPSASPDNGSCARRCREFLYRCWRIFRRSQFWSLRGCCATWAHTKWC